MEKEKGSNIKAFNYKKHRGILICISLLMSLAASTGLIIINKAIAKEKMVPVIIAKTEISKDETFSDNEVEINYEVAKKGLEYLNKEELKDMVAVSKIFKGDPITRDKVIEKETKEEGKVLYSIKLDPADAVAGTIKAGDKINIIAAVDKSDLSQYLFEEAPNVPKAIKVKDVFDVNSEPIQGGTPSSTFTIELSENEAPILRAAEINKKIKFVLARQQ